MTINFYKKIILAAAAFAAAVLSYQNFAQEGFMSDPVVLPPMRTHCVGRYMIDLPEDYELDPHSELRLFYGLGKDFKDVKIEVPQQGGEQSTFTQLIQQEVNELQADQLDESPSKNSLAELKKINDRMTLVRAYRGRIYSFNLDLYAQIGSSVVLFKAPSYKEDRLSDVENRLIKAAQSTTYAANPAQAGKGACLGSAAINAGQDGEVFSILFWSKQRPDVFIRIDMNSLTESGDGGLLRRVDSKADLLAKLGITSTTLRRGKATIGGRPAEELLDQGKDNDKIVRLFTAETLIPVPSSPAKPVIAISMNMGGQVNGGEYIDSSLSKREAVAWWDAVVSSLRPRPGAF